MNVVIIAIFLVILTGCTVKLSGEASMMKQWDRPAESSTTSTVDTSSNARVVPVQPAVTVPEGVKVQSQETIKVK
jgi:hypothetical protein